MNTYGATSILPAVYGSLKEIDPLDAKGDGSGVLLSVGDRAWLPSYAGKMLFYSLESESGKTDNGEAVVIPENNQGDFYWKRQGYTKDTFSGAISGEVFQAFSGSWYPPAGFTGGAIGYDVDNYKLWDVPLQYPNDNWAWYGFGLHNGHIYAINGWTFIKINIETGVSDYVAISGNNNYYYMPGHCLTGNDGSGKYITDIENQTYMSRFNMDLEAEEDIAFIMPPGVTWTDIFGSENPGGGGGLRIGKYHYIFGKYNSPNTGTARVNCLTGQVERLADNPGFEQGATVPDLETGAFYHANRSAGSALLRWNPNDTWTTLAPTNFTGEGSELSWLDKKSNSIVVALRTQQTAIYNIYLDSWSIHSYPSSAGVMFGSYPYWYQDIGAIWPWGYGRINTTELHHAIIPKDNQIFITKT